MPIPPNLTNLQWRGHILDRINRIIYPSLKALHDQNLITTVKLHKKPEDTITECSICYETGNISITKCNHTYHQQCLNNWFKTSKSYTCPYCRTTLA
jgi:hypothetical protein